MSNSQLGEIFSRYKGNPILTPVRWPYEVGATFNPGAGQPIVRLLEVGLTFPNSQFMIVSDVTSINPAGSSISSPKSIRFLLSCSPKVLRFPGQVGSANKCRLTSSEIVWVSVRFSKKCPAWFP